MELLAQWVLGLRLVRADDLRGDPADSPVGVAEDNQGNPCASVAVNLAGSVRPPRGGRLIIVA
eukprot:9334554-Alexandrium_andersonii.AAC.1